MDIRRLLSDPSREWSAHPPAEEEAIKQLRQCAPGDLPEEYFVLLRYCNGGAGPLALEPLYFLLYEAEYVSKLNQNPDQRELYPDFFVFGSNGGLETIAFDTRGKMPWPIVMYDPVAGTESAVTIAKNMEDFIRAIGIDDQE